MNAKKIANRLYSAQISLGKAINYTDFIRANPPQKAEANGQFDQSMKHLSDILGESQIIISDVIIVLGDGSKLSGKLDEGHFKQVNGKLEELMAFFEGRLPKRAVPIVARGNMVALQLFQSSNQLKGALLDWPDGLRPLPRQATEKLVELLFNLARWSNWFLNEKEYIWRLPADDEKKEETGKISGDLYKSGKSGD